MLSTIAITALLGLTASAAPSGNKAAALQARYTTQMPFKFPLSNGFPNIAIPSANLTAIEKQAHGTLPNTALPKSINDSTAATLQLIAFNEIFEVAYFTSLLQNVTRGDCEIKSEAEKKEIIAALTAVQAQEELHALGANAILATAGRTTIKPCEYVFPNTDFAGAVATASLFTDVVLGTLQSALLTFGTDGDSALLPLVGSIIGQEGEQDGYYRSLVGKIPSALPFLTRSSGAFAYSALNQLFVVPGSCPNAAQNIKIPIFKPLTVVTNGGNLSPCDQQVTFSYKGQGEDPSTLSLVYINQQNSPVVEKLQNIQTKNGVTTFTATFPYTANLMNGLTIAALTKSAGPFTSVDAVAAATMYGPGLIEIQ